MVAGRQVPTKKWMDYIELRTKRGLSMSEAAKVVDISYSTAQKFESGDEGSSGHRFYQLFQAGGAGTNGLAAGPIPLEDLSEGAVLALKDFSYFRLRYSGMVNSPWQEDANAVFDELYRKDDQRRYIVFNMHPEAGKTRFIQDKMAQLTARDRAIQGLVGSFANQMAWNMMTALGNMLIRQTPWQATSAALLGGAQDAQATMWEDFGRFKPEEAKRWNRQELLVAQHGGEMLAGKEATWTSYGRESGMNLGSRYDYILWDDLVTSKSMGKDLSTTQELFNWWDNEAETRLNNGGLLILLGQRISGTDLYRHALDKMDFAEGEEIDLVPTGKKYVHLSYKAHDEENCKGPEFHKKDSEPWKPDGTGGCILEPRRVGYRYQMAIKVNNPDTYAIQYQQTEGDPSSVLIPSLWLDGGQDADGERYQGCWDQERGFWEVPAGLGRSAIGIITVDPSPSMYWGIQAWVYVPDPNATRREDGNMGGIRYLVAMLNKKMDAPGFLEYHPATSQYTGVLDEWFDNFKEMGVPLKVVVFEEAAAQRWALQYEIIRNWYGKHNVRVIGHKTHGVNKPDPVLGIPMLKTPYREGRVRLPRKAFQQIRDMIFQLTHYNDTYRGQTDQVMSNWFLEHNLKNIVRKHTEDLPPASSQMRGPVGPSFDPRAVMAR